MSYIISPIGVVDFVEDLRAVLLDGVHLHQVGGKLPGLLTEGKKAVMQPCSIITQDESGYFCYYFQAT